MQHVNRAPSTNLVRKKLSPYVVLCFALSVFSSVRAHETDQHQPVWTTSDGLPLQEKKELEQYLREVSARLERSLHRPEHAESLPLIRFCIYKNGGLNSFEVVTPSQDALIDKACLEAVVKACPYPPLPPKIRRDGLSLETKFEFPALKKDSQDTSSVLQSPSTGGRDASMVTK